MCWILDEMICRVCHISRGHVHHAAGVRLGVLPVRPPCPCSVSDGLHWDSDAGLPDSEPLCFNYVPLHFSVDAVMDSDHPSIVFITNQIRRVYPK